MLDVLAPHLQKRLLLVDTATMGILAAPTTNANALKARPAGYINKKIMESAGDLGVPRIVKKAPTTTKEFSLSSARAHGGAAHHVAANLASAATRDDGQHRHLAGRCPLLRLG